MEHEDSKPSDICHARSNEVNFHPMSDLYKESNPSFLIRGNGNHETDFREVSVELVPVSYTRFEYADGLLALIISTTDGSIYKRCPFLAGTEDNWAEEDDIVGYVEIESVDCENTIEEIREEETGL